MPRTKHGRRDESTDGSMVGSNVAAQNENSSSLSDKGEEEREDYGSTGDNEERPDSD